MNDLLNLEVRVSDAPAIRLTVNGHEFEVGAAADERLADVLRERLGLTGTKIGCNAGDCGACTVLLDGHQVCACMIPLAQARGRRVTTVEGLAGLPEGRRLQDAFLRHGAAQCGICTPGMLMAASDLLAGDPAPDRDAVMDALAGVLCRCTGYRKIVDAVLDLADASPAIGGGPVVGRRVPKIDGRAKVEGRERFGADGVPEDALWLRIVRAPCPARFTMPDLASLLAAHPGLERILTAADVPANAFAIFAHLRDQPVLAEREARFAGEAVAALLGPREVVTRIADEELGIGYERLAPVLGIDAASAEDLPPVHAGRPDNLLIEGRCISGDFAVEEAEAVVATRLTFETSFVEHAYIEPEAGWAEVVDGRLEIHVTTQCPVMDRDETAHVLGLPVDRVRIRPTACGGGFGGKLDLSVQPLVGLGAWLTGRPVALVYERPESMAATTKRHPAKLWVQAGADRDGRLRFFELDADFNTGAYASWGPTVAGRVPIHAPGPYRVPAVRAEARAWFSHAPPAGAFRGFGVPQAALAHETAMDDLAQALGLDRLDFRRRNALRRSDRTPSGQVLRASVGLVDCLDRLVPHWQDLQEHARDFNRHMSSQRQGVGIACMWYGIGNTGMPHPSTIRLGLRRDGRIVLFNGAVDIGQGSNTIVVQIAADALRAPIDVFDVIMGDTDRTADAGKTSASRQTFVSGKAAELAGLDLRAQILRRANVGPDARIRFAPGMIEVEERRTRRRIALDQLEADAEDCVMTGEGRFDPPAEALDENGQGAPYATYAFGAQIARVEVDLELGTTRVLDVVAAHDVGRAINPTQVEGQIEGGIVQGLGFALMEEYQPGRTHNLHDYLIPTVGDIPRIEVILVEDPEPQGPFGAKGVGEPGLIPTAPAILGAIRHATGLRMTRVPVLPHRLRAALRAREADDDGG